MRESIVFYKSFLASIRLLPKKYQLQFYNALFDYGFDGVLPENLPGGAAALFNALKPQVDANNRKYENGKKGGRPKGNQTETKPKPSNNQSITKPKPNVTDNANVNANANANVTDNDNALGSGGGGSDDDFNIWKKLNPEDVDRIYEVYPNTGGLLIDEVFAEVKQAKREVRDPVAYILGYARNKNWDDSQEVRLEW